MGNFIKRILLLVAVMSFAAISPQASLFSAKKITIKTIPEAAEIYIDGQHVGTGIYTVKFDKNNEFYVVTVRKPGYVGRRYRLLKSNPQKTVVYTLPVDEAMEASVGETEGVGLANQWMDIRCSKGMTEDQIWKRLMSVCTSYFSNIEVRDKAAGWIKTNWNTTAFTNQVVRTRLEIRISFTDDEITTFRAKIISEIKDNDCSGNNCFEQYDRVLKKFQPMIDELQTVLGGGQD